MFFGMLWRHEVDGSLKWKTWPPKPAAERRRKRSAAMAVRIFFMGRLFVGSSNLKAQRYRIGYGSDFIIRDGVDLFFKKQVIAYIAKDECRHILNAATDCLPSQRAIF